MARKRDGQREERWGHCARWVRDANLRGCVSRHDGASRRVTNWGVPWRRARHGSDWATMETVRARARYGSDWATMRTVRARARSRVRSQPVVAPTVEEGEEEIVWNNSLDEGVGESGGERGGSWKPRQDAGEE